MTSDLVAGLAVGYDCPLEMRFSPRSRAFTLIELLIVVVVIGVLAMLAVVAYKRWVRTSYMAEAQDMVQNIRSAEEAFKAESGAYLNVSKTLDLGYLYPASTPGAFKSSWGAACSTCSTSTAWNALGVEPKGPVAFGYAVVAATSGAPGPSVNPALTAMAASVSLASLSAPWYVVEAVGDMNGDGVYTRILGNSSSSQVVIDREGE